MALEDRYNLEDLRNHAEQLVFQELEYQLEKQSLPAFVYDQESVLDIAAFALNHVQPLYRATLLGRLYEAEMEEKHRSEVEKAVANAIKKIVDNPPTK